MRDVSAKFAGSVVLVVGAAVALAAGVLLPAIGGWRAGPAHAGSAATAQDGPAPLLTSAKSTGAASDLKANRVERDVPTRVRPPVLTGALAAAAAMPAGADMVLVIENAAELRASPLGDAAVRFLLDASDTAPTRQAWATLSTQLGWSQAETFDRLLGRRVVLVARGIGDAKSARWAMLSDVSLDTDSRLRERLEVSPRAIDQGHQILTIEKGKYELTTHRRKAASDGATGRDSAAVAGHEVTIVLGPSGRSELFDELVGVLANGAPDPLDGHNVIAAASTAGTAEVLLLARLGSNKPGAEVHSAPGDDRWGDYFILSGGRAGLADRARTGCDSAEFTSRVIYCDRARREANLAIKPTSDAVFRALAPGSLLTIVQAAPVQQVLGEAARIVDALRDLPLPPPAKELLGARQVLSLREAETPVGKSPDIDEPGEGERGTSSKHLFGVLALETTSTAKFAPYMDGAISRFIARQEQQFGVVRSAPHDFGGRLPSVTRLLPLDIPDANPLRLFVSDPLTLTWSYPPAHDAQADVHTPADSGPPGWWVMSIAPSPPGLESMPEQAHNAVAAALSNPPVPPRHEPTRWVWIGSAHPADLEHRLNSVLVPDVGGFRSAMRRFERVRVELSINDAGDIQGDLVAKLADTAKK